MASGHNLCRCCRSSINMPDMVNLFATAPHLEVTFEEILARILGMGGKPHSGPTDICVRCSEILIAVEELRILTLESDKFFRRTSNEVKVAKLELVVENLNVELDPPILYEEVKTEMEEESIYEDDKDSSATEEPKESKRRKRKNKTKEKHHTSPTTTSNYRLPSRSDFACCMCIKICDTMNELEDHLSTHTLPAMTDLHVNNPKQCWMCQKRFKDEKNLRLHQVRRYRPKTSIIYQCKHCGKIFQSHNSMRYCELKHEGKNVRYSCELCNGTATSKTNLRTHMKLHTGERKFPCSDCGLAFKTYSVLQRHTLTHTKIRNFSCEVCGNRFTTSSALKVHRRVHTGERPYLCDHTGCGKTFMHATDCHRHQMSHTGERPYACSDCEKRFRTRTLLKMHFRMHIGVKEFKCKLCSVEYFQPRSLKRHMAEKHPGGRR